MSDNARLAKELEDAQLDLDDAKRSRRDLQHQLNIAMQRMDQSTLDADSMRVRCSCKAGASADFCGRVEIHIFKY